MTTTFHWFLPTSGDGHGVGSATVRAGAAVHERAATVGYDPLDPAPPVYFGGAQGLEIAPNLWAGIGLVREGAGTALVGGPDEVAARIDEYVAAGVDELILSGWPHVEEAERVGRLVLPRVRTPQPIGSV